jgi:hypothetical protein
MGQLRRPTLVVTSSGSDVDMDTSCSSRQQQQQQQAAEGKTRVSMVRIGKCGDQLRV